MKKIIYLFLAIGIVSCTSNTIYKKPKDLIPKDSMVMLMQEMYVAASARNVKNKELQTKVNYMPLVYDKFKIDSLRFASSNLYYTSKIEIYNEIVEQVKNNLDTLKKQYELKLKIKDSLKREEKMRNKPKKLKKEDGDSLVKRFNKESKLNDSLLKETIKNGDNRRMLQKVKEI